MLSVLRASAAARCLLPAAHEGNVEAMDVDGEDADDPTPMDLDAEDGVRPLEPLTPRRFSPTVQGRGLAATPKATPIGVDRGVPNEPRTPRRCPVDTPSAPPTPIGRDNPIANPPVGLNTEYDYGWDTRGSGFAYNSHSGKFYPCQLYYFMFMF